IVVDDELEPRKTNAFVGDLREIESQLRIADVHHDLQADIGHFAPADFFDLGFDQAVVDPTLVALGARYGDFAAVIEQIGGIGAPNHCGYAKLARNDRGVAGTADTVGHDGRSQLHDGLPVGVGHVGN